MPAATIEAASSPIADAASGESPARRLHRIMIVEDEFIIAMTVEDALWQAGFAVTGVAASFEQAMALAETDPPDLVLMDIRLGTGRDGIETAIELRRRFDVASIFTSANHDPENIARAAAARPAGWVPKPYALENLVKIVRQSLGKDGRPGQA